MRKPPLSIVKAFRAEFNDFLNDANPQTYSTLVLGIQRYYDEWNKANRRKLKPIIINDAEWTKSGYPDEE